MGLSASQARYLMLVAKQSDLQYQGQQINNERTVLSQQVSELYNSLLSMEVPTPPSTTEFQKVKYSGSVGTTNYSFYASSVKPTGTTYTVTLGVAAYGHSLSDSTVNSVARYGTVGGEEIELFREDGKWCYKDASGNTQEYTGNITHKVGGNEVFTFDDAGSHGLSTETIENYKNAISNSGLKDASGKAYTADDFYIFESGDGTSSEKTIKFVLKKDVDSTDTKSAQTYTYLANGQYTKYEEVSNCKLTFEGSTGRILTLEKPIYDDSGNISGYTSIELSSSTETDEYGYKNAYAQYEYKKYLYDKEQQEINAKTSIIQQEDRNLELKLQRLDTENNEIKTELDAVKEVMKNNIETSYKTFSG